MDIQENYSLKKLNTFGIDVSARYFIELDTEAEISDFLLSEQSAGPLLVLGGGSNILFTKDFDGTVLKINCRGYELVSEDEQQLIISARAGENWDDFVNYCVSKGWGGLENLSGIPGNVGASPIQNIGAYGKELKDHFYELQTFKRETAGKQSFTKADCHFGYRNSIFKTKLKNKFIISSVSFKLDKKSEFDLSYGNLKDILEKDQKEATLENIRHAVLKTRDSKLPDPEITGNAGSFFKNPVVSYKDFALIQESYPDVVAFEQAGKIYKLAAGWLIDQCGWKGKRKANAGVHEKQALVLVNHGNAKGGEILSLANDIQRSVLQKFGVAIEMEVNVV